jgi:hypothetical protein
VLPKDAEAHLLLTPQSVGETRTIDVGLAEEGCEVRFTSRIPLAGVAEAFDPDEPLVQRMTWVVELAQGDRRHPVIPTGLDRTIGVTQDALLLTITRSPANHTNLHVSPVHLITDQVEAGWTESRLRLIAQGPLWNDEPPQTVVWRRFIDESDDWVDVACDVAAASERWSADVDVDDLLPHEAVSGRGTRGLRTKWTMFVLSSNRSPRAVRVDEFACCRFPLEIRRRGRVLTVLPHGGVLQLEVS